MTQLPPTPGPWTQFDDGGQYGKDERHSYGPGFAGVVWGPKGPGHGSIAICGTYNNASPQDAANARLMAASHDLVRLLKALIAHRDTSSCEDPPCVKEACDLLARIGLPYPPNPKAD